MGITKTLNAEFLWVWSRQCTVYKESRGTDWLEPTARRKKMAKMSAGRVLGIVWKGTHTEQPPRDSGKRIFLALGFPTEVFLGIAPNGARRTRSGFNASGF